MGCPDLGIPGNVISPIEKLPPAPPAPPAPPSNVATFPPDTDTTTGVSATGRTSFSAPFCITRLSSIVILTLVKTVLDKS